MISIPRKNVSPNALKWIHRAMIWFALIGLFASIYLLITYLTGGPIACGIVHGCDVVRASKWANTLGVPRPMLGVIFYGVFLVWLVARTTFVPAHRLKLATDLAWAFAFVGFIESGFLTLVQWIDLKAFCMWCLISGVSATAIFALSFFKTDAPEGEKRGVGELAFAFFSMLVAAVVGAILLWALIYRRAELVSTVPVTVDPAIMAQLIPTGTPVEGPADAKVKIVEFLDFECPVCRDFNPTMKAIREKYKGRIAYVIRPFMLPEIHPHAKGAAIAYLCAADQKVGFAYGDKLIENQKKLERDDLIRYATEMRLNKETFTACLDNPAIAQRVVDERKAGEAIGVQATPTLFINDAMLTGIPSEAQFVDLIEEGLK